MLAFMVVMLNVFIKLDNILVVWNIFNNMACIKDMILVVLVGRFCNDVALFGF